MPRLARITLVLLLLVTGFASEAEQPRLTKLGFVDWFSPELTRDVEQLRQGLRDLGYVEGKNIELQTYFTSGDREKTREVTQALIDGGVDILIVSATPAVHIAKELTRDRSIPVIMAPVSDPIASGLVQSLARPGGNLTGLSMIGPDLAGKRLELLREIKPDLKTVAFLGSSRDPNAATFLAGIRTAAEAIGVKVIDKLIEGPGALDEATFRQLKADGAEAVMVQPIFLGKEGPISRLAMTAGLPVVSDYPMAAEAGALLTLGVDRDEQTRRVAYYVDRILKGTSPADLPIEQPTVFRLGVNVKTARALGLTIPQSLLFRADLVVE
jgi:putative tryptophan/tyrosine transport system substrate-binding protein